MSETELAYIAGFFDGEGSITIHDNGKPSPRSTSPNHTLQVSIGNTDPLVLRWIYAEYGGSLLWRKEVRDNHRRCIQWVLRCGKAGAFLAAIRPYLRMKGAQADVAIAYQTRKQMRGPKRVSLEVLKSRESDRAAIRMLNARNFYAEEAA